MYKSKVLNGCMVYASCMRLWCPTSSHLQLRGSPAACGHIVGLWNLHSTPQHNTARRSTSQNAADGTVHEQTNQQSP